jgi:hypothetical protein
MKCEYMWQVQLFSILGYILIDHCNYQLTFFPKLQTTPSCVQLFIASLSLLVILTD